MLTTGKQRSSLSMLTNDDSKILGNLRPKLKRLQESYNNVETSKFKTLNSSWTPLVDKNANTNIFEERVDLVSHWFDLWNDKQRKWFLLSILSRCRPNQICFLEEAFNQIGVYERKDFTELLPTNLSKYVFSFLSAKDLARCAQVSSHWKYLSEQDDIWKSKCLNFGWYLPYKPLEREVGAWKAHYVSCVLNINAKPLNKDEAFKYRESLYKRNLSDSEKENFLHMTTKRRLTSWENYEIQNSRRPWMPNSARPKDLINSEKLLYSKKNINLNQPVQDNSLNLSYKTKYGLPLDSFRSLNASENLKRSKSIHGDMLQDFKKSIPLYLFNIKENYKRMRKSENDLFETRLTETSINAYKTYKDQFLNTNNQLSSQKNELILPIENNIKILFISSKVPCCHMLLQSLKANVVAIPYEFESTNLNTLLRILENTLNGIQAQSIGFFLHFEKPGQLSFTQDSSVYKVNVDDVDISNFFLKIVGKLDEKNGKLDLFVPLASSIDGLELVEKLQKLTTLENIRVPTGFMGNYKFVNSKWINTDEYLMSPTYEYFCDFKLNLWIKYCEILNEAHDRISDLILNGYMGDFYKLATKKIVGSIMFDSLAKSNLLYNINVQNDLKEILTKSANSNNFFLNLLKDLKEMFNETETSSRKVSLDDKKEEENSNDKENSEIELQKPLITPRTSQTDYSSYDNALRSDMCLRNFLKNKTLPEQIEPSMRTQIALEIVRSEINYMKILEMIQKYYARPLKSSNDSGHVIVSDSVIELLFNDLAILYNVSKEMVKELNLRVKSWSILTCVGDIFNKLIENFQCFVNFANNYDTILTTLDKLLMSNPKFRAYLLQIDTNNTKNIMTIQEMMDSPWPHIKELMNLLGSLQLHTSKDHPDYLNITKSLNKIRELYLFVKQVQERIENRNKMLEIQRKVINLPDIMGIGRYLLLEEKAILLNKTYKFVKDITCFLFNDSLLLAYRIKKHFPFSKYVQESLVYYDLISNLKFLTIDDVTDSYYALNAIHLKLSSYQEYFLEFDSNEKKFNFLNQLKSIKQLIS